MKKILFVLLCSVRIAHIHATGMSVVEDIQPWPVDVMLHAQLFGLNFEQRETSYLRELQCFDWIRIKNKSLKIYDKNKKDSARIYFLPSENTVICRLTSNEQQGEVTALWENEVAFAVNINQAPVIVKLCLKNVK